jgi:hypothetical protein
VRSFSPGRGCRRPWSPRRTSSSDFGSPSASVLRLERQHETAVVHSACTQAGRERISSLGSLIREPTRRRPETLRVSSRARAWDRWAASSTRLRWSDGLAPRGVYFFVDPSEPRTDSGTGARLVRVGTHAVKTTSRATLWTRLAQHRGTRGRLGGNHRASIFRNLVGEAVARRDGLNFRTWGYGSSARAAASHFGVPRERLLADELELEQATSGLIGELPLVVLPADELADRVFVERDAVALLSNFGRAPIDPASSGWLGRHSKRARVSCSGLWNNDYVDEAYEPSLIERVDAMMRIDGTSAGIR